MGVPAFFRWLSEKYPKCITDVLEERVHLSPDGSTKIPIDATKPNPSGLECDNLYIDMNGIIHPCSHPENGPQPKTEAEMYHNVCMYVDRLFSATRPRKLLYLAIDGVAPRAKMNQQRSRRFKSAQEVRDRIDLEKSLQTSMAESNLPVPTLGKTDDDDKPWDSNVITPGTPFMIHLADYVRFYIRVRISKHPAWRSIKVIFSDASIPGEGEHKIMDHIRRQRVQPGYDPNIVHVLHGLDADLIMLALATHEAHFYILREEVVFGRRGGDALLERREQSGFADAQRLLDENAGTAAMQLRDNTSKTLQRLSIPVLREYLQHEFKECDNVPFVPRSKVSFERVIDDIVFLCFFVGNDFLPHLPSLDIRDGALDFLFNVYKRILPTLGTYITDHGGEVNLTAVDVILAEVGAIEDHVFKVRHDDEEREKKRRMEFKRTGVSEATFGQRLAREEGMAMLAVAAPASSAHMAASEIQSVSSPTRQGRAARALAKRNAAHTSVHMSSESEGRIDGETGSAMPLKRKISVAENTLRKLKQIKTSNCSNQSADKKSKNATVEENARAAEALRKSLKNPSQEGIARSKKKEIEHKSANTFRDIGESDVEPNAVKATECLTVVKGDADGRASDLWEIKSNTEVEPICKKEEDSKNGDGKQLGNSAEEEAAAKLLLMERIKTAEQEKIDKLRMTVDDKVRLHQPGWKDRYYRDKCKADDIEGNGGRELLFKSYVMGLAWVMRYYYNGVCSWKWYFPFHYAPFASDLKNIERFGKACSSFELNEPFRPVEQLMAVLPSDSAHAVPKASRWLMCDDESPVIDFYPKEVPCDPNGKAMPWLWVVLLPFIDEDRLFASLKPTQELWTAMELFCNSRGLDDGYLYVHSSHPMADTIQQTLTKGAKKRSLGDASRWNGFCGSVAPPLSNERMSAFETVNPPNHSISRNADDDELWSPLESNQCLCAAFTEPVKLPHKSRLLMGTKVAGSILQHQDHFLKRPRLNRVQTIANLGSSAQSTRRLDMHHGDGYGGRLDTTWTHQSTLGRALPTEMKQWVSLEPMPRYTQQSFGAPMQMLPSRNSNNRQLLPQYVTSEKAENAFHNPHNSNNFFAPGFQGSYNGSSVGNFPSERYDQTAHFGQPNMQTSSHFGHTGNGFQAINAPMTGGHYQNNGYGAYVQQPVSYAPGPPHRRPPTLPPPLGQPSVAYNIGHQLQSGDRSVSRISRNNAPTPRPGVNPNLMSSLRSQLAHTLQRNRKSEGNR